MALNSSDQRRLLPFARWLLLGLVAAALGCNSTSPPPAPGAVQGQAASVPAVAVALTGKLDVFVRPAGRAIEPLAVEAAGALPARPGGVMSLQVQLSEPAYTYFVWLDCREKALPLYPWNIETLDVTDLGQPPPLRKPAKVIYSPLLGGGWEFGDKGGLETVLLLARRTPLPADVNLATIIKPLPHAVAATPTELTILGLDGGADSPTVLHPAGSAETPGLKPDDPLGPLLISLGEHFELIRAVRFAHADQ